MKSDIRTNSSKAQILKMKLDTDQAKVAISMSLLAIVFLVTVADRNLLMSRAAAESTVAMSSSSVSMANSRGIASVSENPIAPDSYAAENQAFVRDLATRDLGPNASIGHNPSSVEKLAFGFLEGKYSVRLHQGKIAGIEFSEANIDGAKKIENFAQFIESNRDLLPEFKLDVRVSSAREGSDKVESYQLLNATDVPVANVQFRMDEAGHLLAVNVAPLQVASK